MVWLPQRCEPDENVKVVHTLVICDRRRDLRSIASEVGITFGAVQSIPTDILGISKVLARCSRLFYRASCNPR